MEREHLLTDENFPFCHYASQMESNVRTHREIICFFFFKELFRIVINNFNSKYDLLLSKFKPAYPEKCFSLCFAPIRPNRSTQMTPN